MSKPSITKQCNIFNRGCKTSVKTTLAKQKWIWEKQKPRLTRPSNESLTLNQRRMTWRTRAEGKTSVSMVYVGAPKARNHSLNL